MKCNKMFTTSCTAENLRWALTETASICTKLFYSKKHSNATVPKSTPIPLIVFSIYVGY